MGTSDTSIKYTHLTSAWLTNDYVQILSNPTDPHIKTSNTTLFSFQHHLRIWKYFFYLSSALILALSSQVWGVSSWIPPLLLSDSKGNITEKLSFACSFLIEVLPETALLLKNYFTFLSHTLLLL